MPSRRDLLAMLTALPALSLSTAALSTLPGPVMADRRVRAEDALGLPVGNPQAVAFFTAAVLAETNAARRAHRIGPLSADTRLSAAAIAQSRHQARTRTLGHLGANQAPLGSRLKTQGVRFSAASENVARQKVLQIAGRPVTQASIAAAAGGRGCGIVYADSGQVAPTHTVGSLAAAVVAQWLASPKHRANLLDPRFTRMGAGFAVDDGGPACGDVYVTQDFAG